MNDLELELFDQQDHRDASEDMSGYTLFNPEDDYFCSMLACEEKFSYREVQEIDGQPYCPSCFATIQDMGRPYIEEPSY